jgi:tetratricopeptide (TPR) repeat protein
VTQADERPFRSAAILRGVAFAALALALLAWPIVPHDTDLFYHLNFGRRIASTLSLPHTAFYSYVESTHALVDYYWLSQLVFYWVDHALGSIGLIALRAALFLALSAVVVQLAARSSLGRASPTRAACVVVPALLVTLERYSTVRPHMFSYLFLATALLCVELGGRALLLLVPIAVLWSNLHGIEYPVFLLVLGGAVAERLVRIAVAVGDPKAARSETLVLCGAAAALLANPFGARLLPVPFTPLGLVGQAIFELQTLRITDLISFGFEKLVPTWEALRAVVLGVALACAITNVARKTMQLRHLVWLTFGLYLLTRAPRFSIEFTLLSLPTMLASDWLAGRPSATARGPLRVVLWGALAALTVARIDKITRGPFAYPLADNFLPRGTAALLRAHAPSGRVLHHPNYGGYLEWTFGDRFTIGADLQTPFLFPGTRVLELSSAFAEPRPLQAAAAIWRADYVLVPWSDIAQLEPGVSDKYAPVGFDDVVVAYAHRERCAAFVSRFELHALVPANLNRLLYGQLPASRLTGAEYELARLEKIDSHVAVVHTARAVVAAMRGARAQALQHARAAVALAPGQLEALRVAGEIELEQGLAADALPQFMRALELVEASGAPPVLRSRLAWGAARALTALGRARETYALIAPVFGDVTSTSVTAGDLKLLAAAAGDAAETSAARTLARLAAIRSGLQPAGQQ